MTILYIYSDKELYYVCDELIKLLVDYSVYYEEEQEKVIVFAQKICLHEEDMKKLLDEFYDSSNGNICLQYSILGVDELYFRWN